MDYKEHLKVEDYHEKVIKIVKTKDTDIVLCKLYLDVDGFWYIDFNINKNRSWFESHTLKMIVQIVDELNKPMHDQIDEYYLQEENKDQEAQKDFEYGDQ